MFHGGLSFIQASHCGGRETQGRITTVGPSNSISSNQHLKATKSSLLHSMISLSWEFYYTRSGLLKLPRKSCRVQMNKCLITKNPLLLFACSCGAAASHPEKQAWARESLPAALIQSKSHPGVPRRPSGSCRVPAGCQAALWALLCLRFGLCFYSHCYYQNLYFDGNRRFPSSSAAAWKSMDFFQIKPKEVNDLRCVTAD